MFSVFVYNRLGGYHVVIKWDKDTAACTISISTPRRWRRCLYLGSVSSRKVQKAFARRSFGRLSTQRCCFISCAHNLAENFFQLVPVLRKTGTETIVSPVLNLFLPWNRSTANPLLLAISCQTPRSLHDKLQPEDNEDRAKYFPPFIHSTSLIFREKRIDMRTYYLSLQPNKPAIPNSQCLNPQTQKRTKPFAR